MARGIGEGRGRRGGGLATKMALVIGLVIVVFMVSFAVFLRGFIREAVTQQLLVTAYEAARAASKADMEAWHEYRGTPYVGFTPGEVQKVVDGYRSRAEMEQAFLTTEQKRRVGVNLERWSHLVEGDSLIVSADFYFDDPAGTDVGNGRPQTVRTSLGADAELTFRASRTKRVFAEGDAVLGQLAINGRRSTVIRGTHTMRNSFGDVAGDIAVYIDAKSIEATTDDLMTKVSGASIVFILVGLAVAYLLGRQLAKPIGQLQDDIRIVAGGDFDHTTRAHSSDEIGDLARQFNAMTRNLAEARDAERQVARSRRQITAAAEVTDALRPETMPTIAGYDVAAHHESAQQLAREYYDVIEMGDGRTGFLVATASGEGVPAAMVMAMARSYTKALGREIHDPGELLRQVNAMLSSDLRHGMFVSMLLVVLDPATGNLDIANAGHPPLVLSKPGGKTIPVHSEGIALGFDEGPVFDDTLVVRTLGMEPGDRFVIFSEGCTALKNGASEELGEARWVGLVKREAERGADEFVARVAATFAKFRGKRDMVADVTFVTVGRQV